jgi:signal transduction histidine kinase
MHALRRSSSLRTRFLLVVVGAALLPLATLGLWLVVRIPQSGERLLRGRLDAALDTLAQDAGSHWQRVHSALALVTEDERLQRGLLTAADRAAPDLPLPALAKLAGDWRSGVQRAVVSDAARRPRWALTLAHDSATPYLVQVADTSQTAVDTSDTFVVELPVLGQGISSEQIGTMRAWLRVRGIFADRAERAAALGGVIAVLSQSSRALLPPGVLFDPEQLQQDRFVWMGEEWMTSSRRMDELGVTLRAAAPLSPFIAPFADAARIGVWALAVMTVVAFVVALLLTRRLTRSLEQLATAADAVSRGDLDQRIGSHTRDEVGRVAQAFDGMAESLRRTLRQLSERRAIAAVGEFASTLAHEVRNPLGAMRLSLQSIEERIGDDPQLRSQMRQALGDVERLEGTVSGALQVARSGRVSLERIDVRLPLELAVRNASPEFARQGAVLEPIECSALATMVHGDSAALERLFLNLLLNSAQALNAGQHAGVRIDSRDRVLTVSVWDRGSGIPLEVRQRVLEPFYSTKPEGTGLGLSIARQIVAAHAGELQIESQEGEGTTIRVILPLAV